MARFHIFSQYVWPDSGPDGLLAEQLAARLQDEGHEVQLIGGKGTYRPSYRAKPEVPILHVDHYCGRRGKLVETFVQYAAVMRAFENHIKRTVRADDIVIVTSAPPTSVRLADCIHRRGARAIYWLQDYYPELIRGLREYPVHLRRALRAYWDGQLARWDRVVKIGSNLPGPSSNSVVIRNWPTMDMASPVSPEPRTALYSGNLGYGHDIGLLVQACEELRDRAYTITLRADGPGVRHLPAWLKPVPLHRDPACLREELLRNEIHLVAADPRITQAIFPSKIWNSLAAQREVIGTGFAAEMAVELEAAKRAPFSLHLAQWVELLAGLAGVRSKSVLELAA
jgi:glycosyltransferase involved in cell wall biosynthesis